MITYAETEEPDKMVNIFNKVVKRPTISAMLVRQDELHLYTIPDEQVPYIKAIHCVYLYDKKCKTHLCEMTPSYYLMWLYTSVEFTDLGDALSEEEKQEYYEEYEHSGADQDKYYHCHTIDARPTKNKYRIGATRVKYTETSYDEQMEALREHYCCNHYL